MKSGNPTAIAIYDIDGNFVRKVSSVKSAKTFTKIHKSRISDCLQNRSNYAGKFRFRYVYGTRCINKLI